MFVDSRRRHQDGLLWIDIVTNINFTGIFKLLLALFFYILVSKVHLERHAERDRSLCSL